MIKQHGGRPYLFLSRSGKYAVVQKYDATRTGLGAPIGPPQEVKYSKFLGWDDWQPLVRRRTRAERDALMRDGVRLGIFFMD